MPPESPVVPPSPVLTSNDDDFLLPHGDENVIRIRGARTHNLLNVDVDIPTGRLIVMTGVSGSGKSSLAFDTLFAEGQRRYLESVSVHTRSLLQQLQRADVDEISGLPPTVSVDQRATTAPARSTLAITTEIYDFLRLLFARAGTAHCTTCSRPVTSQSVDRIVQQTMQLPERTKLMILAPLVRSRRGAHREILDRIAGKGFVRSRIDGQLADLADTPALDPKTEHTIEAVVDRIILKEGIQQRLRESIDLACRESDGMCIVCRQDGDEWSDSLFSTRFSCADCDLSFPNPEPRIFSFHTAWGACLKCQGFGIAGTVESEDDLTVFRRQPCPGCHGSRLLPFPSGITFLNVSIAQFTAQTVAQALKTVVGWQHALATQNTPEAHTHDVSLSDPTPSDLAHRLTQEARLVAQRTIPEIRQRLECLLDAGVGYLTLARPTRTLSGGEYQRARLAACLGTQLHGACFVLDEPTTGLHPRDTRRLLDTLLRLRDSGATVVVVEHDGEIIRAADWLIDLGPGAGRNGGTLMFAGSPQDAATATNSPTAQYLAGTLGQPSSPASQHEKLPAAKSTGGDPAVGVISIVNARQNNLQGLSVEIPLQKLVAVTGVSGSGKSTLVMDTLLPVAIAAARDASAIRQACADAECDAVEGLCGIDRVISVDNSPLSRQSRSCIATFSGLWVEIRKLFAKTRDARARGFTSRRFSFNSGEGRCKECAGTGVHKLKMSFLPDARIPCPACRGRRFDRMTLSVQYAGKSAADVLAMCVEEACHFFEKFSRLHAMLSTFRDVGLGYMTLGQSAATFSGGEAQRVRLATELISPGDARTLFILDEPTTGLHPADVLHLQRLLRQLVDRRHTVIVIEHNTDLISQSDYVIDIGPESGPDGGRMVFAGTPLCLSECFESHTGRALANGNIRR